MNKQSEKAYGVGRLESKTARAAIVQKIATDFNLMPIIAEAYYKQISIYFHQHADTTGNIGTMVGHINGVKDGAAFVHNQRIFTYNL